MQIRDISFDTPQENLFFDEVLLQLATQDAIGESLRFWESARPFIVLGRLAKESEDIYLEQAQADHIPILRRTSGGGTVVQGPGCLNFTFVFDRKRHPDLADLRKSYVWINGKVIEALWACGIQAVFKPISDIALAAGEKKFSGNAQHRTKQFILHHGTILYDFDLKLISRYLKIPKDVPEYRRKRPHEEFVTNISLQPTVFKQSLAGLFGLSSVEQPPKPSSQELLALQKLLNKSSTELIKY